MGSPATRSLSRHLNTSAHRKNVYPGTEKQLLDASLLIIPGRTGLKLGEVETSNTLKKKTIQHP